jgi:hypothetical protein
MGWSLVKCFSGVLFYSLRWFILGVWSTVSAKILLKDCCTEKKLYCEYSHYRASKRNQNSLNLNVEV